MAYLKGTKRGGRRAGAGRKPGKIAPKQSVNLTLTREQYNQLGILARQKGFSKSEVVGLAVNELFDVWYISQTVMCASCGKNEAVGHGEELCQECVDEVRDAAMAREN